MFICLAYFRFRAVFIQEIPTHKKAEEYIYIYKKNKV